MTYLLIIALSSISMTYLLIVMFNNVNMLACPIY